jgi:hypothetical protein
MRLYILFFVEAHYTCLLNLHEAAFLSYLSPSIVVISPYKFAFYYRFLFCRSNCI